MSNSNIPSQDRKDQGRMEKKNKRILKNPFLPMASTSPFQDASPSSMPALTEQSWQLLEHLQGGGTINFMDAQKMGITHLGDRIAELQAHDIRTYQRRIQIFNTKCLEYSLRPFVDG